MRQYCAAINFNSKGQLGMTPTCVAGGRRYVAKTTSSAEVGYQRRSAQATCKQNFQRRQLQAVGLTVLVTACESRHIASSHLSIPFGHVLVGMQLLADLVVSTLQSGQVSIQLHAASLGTNQVFLWWMVKETCIRHSCACGSSGGGGGGGVRGRQG
jgi:hypothetical protein